MYYIAKILCLCLYLFAALSLLIAMPHGVATALRYTSILFTAVHVLEIIFCLKILRLYQGALAASILLTLLFGFLHWKPLLDASKLNIKS